MVWASLTRIHEQQGLQQVIVWASKAQNIKARWDLPTILYVRTVGVRVSLESLDTGASSSSATVAVGLGNGEGGNNPSWFGLATSLLILRTLRFGATGDPGSRTSSEEPPPASRGQNRGR